MDTKIKEQKQDQPHPAISEQNTNSKENTYSKEQYTYSKEENTNSKENTVSKPSGYKSRATSQTCLYTVVYLLNFSCCSPVNLDDSAKRSAKRITLVVNRSGLVYVQ